MAWNPEAGFQSGLRQMLSDISLVRVSQILITISILTSRVMPLTMDNCDVTIWDTGSDAIGVRDVTNACAEGRVDWRSPHGAIRLSLRPNPQPHKHRQSFEVCLLAAVHHTSIKISLENPLTDLKPLTLLSRDTPTLERELCYQSSGSSIVFFMETDVDNESASVGHFQLEYDVRYLRPPGERQYGECRPCTDEEVLDAVCSSDLVFSGRMDQVKHNTDKQETSIHLEVGKVYRQKNDIIQDPNSPSRLRRDLKPYPRLKFHTKFGVREYPSQAMTSVGEPSTRKSQGVLVAPHSCEVHHGTGEFLFIGSIRFKKAFLHCAPRLEDFNKLWSIARMEGRTMCLLN